MRRTLRLLSIVVALLTLLSATAAAGTGLKIESDGGHRYTVAGLDFELGLPFVPLRLFSDVLGWYANTDDQITHGQVGVGARVFLTEPSKGLFAEGKFRYIFGLDQQNVETSTAITAGLGYRVRAFLGGLDIVVQTRLTENEIIPQYNLGIRVGF